jgi:hypothetical protein
MMASAILAHDLQAMANPRPDVVRVADFSTHQQKSTAERKHLTSTLQSNEAQAVCRACRAL